MTYPGRVEAPSAPFNPPPSDVGYAAMRDSAGQCGGFLSKRSSPLRFAVLGPHGIGYIGYIDNTAGQSPRKSVTSPRRPVTYRGGWNRGDPTVPAPCYRCTPGSNRTTCPLTCDVTGVTDVTDVGGNGHESRAGNADAVRPQPSRRKVWRVQRLVLTRPHSRTARPVKVPAPYSEATALHRALLQPNAESLPATVRAHIQLEQHF